MNRTLSIKEREQAMHKATELNLEGEFPSCDAYESGCTCDLCGKDDLTAVMEEWVGTQ